MNKYLFFVILLFSSAILFVSLFKIFSNPTQVEWSYQILSVLSISIMSFSSSWMLATRKNDKAIEEARKEVRAKWLPAAESAYKGLINIQYAVNLLKQNHGGWCKDLQSVFPEIEKKSMTGMKKYVGGKCENVCSQLDSLHINLESAMSDWNSYISQNCSDDECKPIFQRINEIGKEYLGWEFDEDQTTELPQPIPSTT